MFMQRGYNGERRKVRLSPYFRTKPNGIENGVPLNGSTVGKFKITLQIIIP
jgi:hypothetical protein